MMRRLFLIINPSAFGAIRGSNGLIATLIHRVLYLDTKSACSSEDAFWPIFHPVCSAKYRIFSKRYSRVEDW
jgi:hypothetical protein